MLSSNNVEEIWKPMTEFPELYKVSNLGRIASYRQILAQSKINSGYLRVTLKVNNKAINRLVHRVVAQAFLPNPDNKKEVNHKDGNRLNNTLCNLEWVTSCENKQHGRDVLGNVYNKPSTGKKLSKVSKYHNVGFDKSRDKWFGVVRLNKVNYYQKRFDTEEEAATHVNWILDTLGLTDRPRNIIEKV